MKNVKNDASLFNTPLVVPLLIIEIHSVKVYRMSKQINYYMDKNTEKQFLQFIYNNKYIVIDKHGKELDILICKEKSVFLTKANYLPYLKYRYDIVDVLNSLVIELARSDIDEEKKLLKEEDCILVMLIMILSSLIT